MPNPVKLTPYRTFLEVKQPASDFIFRMKQDKYDGIVCAIFEADGGAWKMEAAHRIKEYLQKELMDIHNLQLFLKALLKENIYHTISLQKYRCRQGQLVTVPCRKGEIW